MAKFNYYLCLEGEFVKADEHLFKDLINVYSHKFGIWKFDSDNRLSCESELKCNDLLYYYLGNRDINKFYYFGIVYKVED